MVRLLSIGIRKNGALAPFLFGKHDYLAISNTDADPRPARAAPIPNTAALAPTDSKV